MNPFKDLSDEKLMVLYQNDETQAFDILYERHKSKVYTYLKKRLKKDYDEVFQNVFVKFHKSRSKYDPKYPLLKWLYTLCRNELLDHVKKKKLDTVPYEDEFNGHEDLEALSIDTDQLPLTSREKEVIDLKFNEDKEYSEIAEILNLKDDNVRKIFSRAIAKLRKLYE